MPLTRNTDKTPALHEVEPRRFERDFDGLCEQLAHGRPDERRWAARDLGQHPQAAEVLCQRLAAETDASVRAALFTSVSRIGSHDVVARLLPMLRSEDAALRNGALEVLAGLPALVAPAVDALLLDDDHEVRIFAVNLLVDLCHEAVGDWLLRVLESEPEPNVVGAALEVIAEVGGREALPALAAVRTRFAAEPYLVFAADVARSRIEGA
jgi:HEAT repeat protein